MRKQAYASIDKLPDSYREFLDRAERRRYFHGARWYQSFTRTGLERDAQMWIYAVESDDPIPTPMAILMTRSPAGQNGSKFPDRLYGADTLASMTSHQSVFFAPQLAEGITTDETRELLRDLVDAVCTLGPSWAVIDLNHLDDDACPVELLVEAFRDGRMIAESYYYRSNLYEPIANRKFEDYLAARPSIVRKNYCRMARKLEKSGEVDFRVLRNESEVAAGITAYKQVRANSWKEAEPFPEHTTALIRASASAGALRLGFLYLGGVPVATQLWINVGGLATIYKIHHDQNFRKQSVGAVLTLRMFEYSIDVDKVKEIDFGVGDEPAKRPWLSEDRPLYGLLAFDPRTPSGLLALLRHRMERACDRVKNGVKPLVESLAVGPRSRVNEKQQ